jgi:hypothetical protein
LNFIPKLTRTTGKNKSSKKMRIRFVCLGNIGEEEARWKEEFSRYQERIQQWDYYYTKYLDLLEKNKEKLFNCLG